MPRKLRAVKSSPAPATAATAPLTQSDAVSLYHPLVQEAVHAVMAGLEEKDTYTYHHSLRVAEYCRSLAEALGLEHREVLDAELCGLLHDVGKMGVPDGILQKADRLTPAEFALMKTHPVRSAKIVEKIGDLEHLLPGIRHHHERWDGFGYPDNLKAEEIPFLSRVVLIADTFDAMTSTRPYRLALTTETALAELRRCMDTQFDRRLVEAFCALVEAGELSPSVPRKKIA